VFERVLNAAWVVLGGAIAVHAWSLGVLGPEGPGSGLFPFVSGVIVAAAGLALMVRVSDRVDAPNWPDRIGTLRVLGVVAGLAVIAGGLELLGFAAAGALTMVVLMRFVERASWASSVALSAGSVIGTIWLFDYMLGMPLPRGPWGW
jgi:putative tricarboxylic transport membrane protein